MVRIILAGCHGRMGNQVTKYCMGCSDMSISAGLTRENRPTEHFPVFSDFNQCRIPADVLIDFSHPEALEPILALCVRRKLPAVLAVTGYSHRQLEQIRLAARSVPIFRSSNLSVGANLLRKLTQQAAGVLGADYDVAIIERHHRCKTDSPSGTALMLSKSFPKTPAMHSIRAGTIAGEHTVLFAGTNEVLEFTHRADSREVYAAGAVRAARFISKVTRPGLYGMDHMLK